MHLRKIIFASILMAVVAFSQSLDTGFQVRYAGNLDKGESYINIINDGAQGASPNGPGINKTLGQICVNVYAFSPDEQMVSCCSCPITANGVVNIGANRDLVSNTLTGFTPTSVTVKLVAVKAGENGVATDCKYSAMGALNPVSGMVAFGSTLHPQNVGGVAGWATVETPFIPATLSGAESTRLTTMCTNIYGNGSLYGICGSCQPGALGAKRK